MRAVLSIKVRSPVHSAPSREHRALTARLFVACCSLLLAGCGIGPYNVEVLCEKREGEIAIQVVSYDRYSISPLPHVGGEDRFAGIRVVGDGFFGSTTWIGDTYLPYDYFDYAPEVCRRSDIEGSVVAIVPIYDHENLARHVRWDRLNYKGEEANVIVLGSAGEEWVVRGVPDDGSPFVATAAGELVASVRWLTSGVNVGADHMAATQQIRLRAPLLELSAKDSSSFMHYLRGNPKRAGCPECEPVIERTMVSFDEGMTWQLESYRALRPLPEGSVVRGDDYYYDVAKQKVLPKIRP